MSQQAHTEHSIAIHLEASWRYQIACICLFICFSYANSLYSPFILDDFHSFIYDQSVFIENFNFDSLTQLTQTKFGLRRFIPMLTFAIDQHLANGRISQYHITNIAIHIAAAISVYFLLINLLSKTNQQDLTQKISPNLFAFVVTSLWALSPVQTNAVTYIVQRMTSLSTLFYITAINFYILARTERKRLHKVLLAILFIVGSILSFTSKEISATLPVIILLIEYFFLDNNLIKKFFKNLSKKAAILYASLVLLLSPIFLNKFLSLTSGYAIRNFTLKERLLTESRVVVHYISLLLAPLPSRLNLDYDFTISKGLFSPPQTIFSILFILLSIYFCIKNRKKYPLIVFGVLFFYINLIIESTIVPLEIIFEHRMYLPSIGFFIFLTALIDIGYSKIENKSDPIETKKIFIVLAIIIFTISSLLTTFRNYDWRDSISIYADTLKKSPHKPRALVNAGLAYGRNGQYDISIKLSAKAIEEGTNLENEETLKAGNNILVSLNHQKKYFQSIEFANQFLLNVNPKIKLGGYSLFLHNLGAAYYYTNQYQEALNYFEKSYLYDESYDSSYANIDTTDATLNTIIKIHENDHLNSDIKEDDQTVADIAYRELFDILMKYRKYDSAYLVVGRYIDKKENSTGKYIVSKYMDIMSKNSQSLKLNNLASHDMHIKNIRYRTLVKTFFFCKKNYNFLNIHPYLLNELNSTYPHDRWVAYWMASEYLEKHKYEQAEQIIIDENLADSNLTPALELLANINIAKRNNEAAIMVYNKILQTYPGIPAWRKFLVATNKQIK